MDVATLSLAPRGVFFLLPAAAAAAAREDLQEHAGWGWGCLGGGGVAGEVTSTGGDRCHQVYHGLRVAK